jgi:N,N'-diacetyllegionaminate synthase
MATDDSVRVIAEVGVNHNGQVSLAMKLLEESISAGANIVKFQTFDPSELTDETALTAPYQSEERISQRNMLTDLTLSDAQFRQLADHTRILGAEFLTTAFDVRSLKFAIEELGIRRVKIPSGEITNPILLHFAGKSGLPILLSTGMAAASEISAAIEIINAGRGGIELRDLKSIKNSGAAAESLSNLTIMHCISLYPCPPQHLNLLSMERFRAFVGCDLGLSDHTSSILAPSLSVALGSLWIEKHITLDREMAGPDHAASLEPAEFKEMVRLIREAEVLLGSRNRELSEAEVEMRQYARRGVYAKSDIAAEDPINLDNIKLSRPETRINAMEILEGNHFADFNLEKGTALSPDNLSVRS